MDVALYQAIAFYVRDAAAQVINVSWYGNIELKCLEIRGIIQVNVFYSRF
ncbi:MAG: hypothetical protein ABI741_07150 [Ferruginibacter sp.]